MSFAYAGDSKFVVKADGHGCALGQTAITIIKELSDSMLVLLSVQKNVVLHCGAKNEKYQHIYMLGDCPMPTVDVIQDLGVLRFELKPYSDHITHLSANCWQLFGVIRRAYRSCDAELLRAAYQAYVLPKIMCAASVWSLF